MLKKILITGANGMLGQDLTSTLKEKGYFVIETDIHNMDITNESNVREFLSQNSCDLVIHCAAYTNVDGAESNKDTAFLINEKGSENLAIITNELNIPIVYISTDYVFDGTKSSPYEPDDKTNPLNVYGQSKLAGEIAVKSNNPKHYICRTSWLYGHKGKNFVETMIALSKTKPELKVVNDQFGCPTWTVELANAIISLIAENKPFGTYHTCGAGITTWYGFAKKALELSNSNTPVIPVNSSEFPTIAVRPKYSAMNNNGICRNWEKALEEYIILRK